VSQLIKSDPNNLEVQTLNALLLLNNGKIDDAFTLLKKAAKGNPTSVPTQLLLARVASGKGDQVAAEASWTEATKLSPGNIEAATGLASIANQKGDAALLSQVAEKMIQLHPDFTDAYFWRATAEANQKQFDKALADLQIVLTRNPESSAAYLQLGQIRVAQGHIPEGVALIQKALDKNPNSNRALAELVAYDLQSKQPAKAIARVQAQIAKVPGNGNFYSQLAALQLLQTKDLKGALDNSQKAMQLSPTSFDAVQIYTQTQVALGNIDPAISTLLGWVNSHPTDANATQMVGVFEETKGDQSKAVDYYKKALQLDPNNAVAANNLAYLMVENGQNVDVALSLAQTARRVWPNAPQTADTLAWVYFYKGNYSSARDLLETALKQTPDDAAMHFHLGMTYSKLNRKADAQLQLKKAVSLAPDTKAGKDASAELAKLG
jgi:tetratricopeptide (TPR) repeat protein